MRLRLFRPTFWVVAAGLGASCSYGADPERRVDFVVFYAGQSTVLDDGARQIVGRAARAAGSSDVVVAGYADDPGAPEANQIQSRIRAQLVADQLVADGVARRRVTLSPRRALGGEPGTESRRVDIRIGD